MTWYRPRDGRIEAIRWLGEENCEEVFAFLDLPHPEDEKDHSCIHVDGGDVYPGDWIIRCPEGAYYEHLPMGDMEFDAEYQLEEA